jgi:hypothetical protein
MARSTAPWFAGNITEVRLVPHKTFCFIGFDNPASADAAIAKASVFPSTTLVS